MTARDQTAPLGFMQAAAMIAADIKIAHSIFAMPFAILAGCMVAGGAGGAGGVGGVGGDGSAGGLWGKLGLIVVCMVLARTWAMLINRLVDRRIDVQNQRTKRRIFASGSLSATTGWWVAGACAAGFSLVAALFGVFYDNWLPVMLSVPVLAWIAFYSFTKRFTALCHLFLGGALAASPLAAGIAVNPEALWQTPAIFYMAGFVLVWVAGFDVIYALQDEDFDREAGLSSIPSKLGTRGAIWVSRGLHVVAAGLIVMVWRSDVRFGWVFGSAVLMVLGLLVLEHMIVAKRGKAGLDMAFFTVNGVVSCLLGAAGCVDVLLVTN